MAENVFPGKILLVDDDNDLRQLYAGILQKSGYTVDLAVNGSEGYAKILQGGYDLVLLDLMMPDLDGISILKKLHESQPNNTYSGSIIVLSQIDQPQVIETAFKLGAKGYLVKSKLEPTELTSKISQILQSAS